MKKQSLVKNIENRKVEVIYLGQEIFLPTIIKENIEKYWQEVKNQFRRGKIFVVQDIIENDDKLSIYIYFSDYAHYIYAKRNDVDLEYKCKNLWAGILLETNDNKYLFGEMSDITSTAGEYHISGGSCDLEELENGYLNYEKTMYRELKEEFNLDEKDLEDVKIKFLKLPSKEESDIGILYKGKLNKSSKEIKNQYDEYIKKLKETNGEIEFSKLIFVEKDLEEIKKFSIENKNILMEFTEEMLIDDFCNKKSE